MASWNNPYRTVSLWRSYSVHTGLMPYMEQTQIYDRIKFLAMPDGDREPAYSDHQYRTWNSGTHGRGRLNVLTDKIPALICPASRRPPNRDWYWGGGPGSNYAVSVGPMLYWQYNELTAPGAFSPHTETMMAEITDGLANTILAAEIRTGDGDGNFYLPGEPIRCADLFRFDALELSESA